MLLKPSGLRRGHHGRVQLGERIESSSLRLRLGGRAGPGTRRSGQAAPDEQGEHQAHPSRRLGRLPCHEAEVILGGRRQGRHEW